MEIFDIIIFLTIFLLVLSVPFIMLDMKFDLTKDDDILLWYSYKENGVISRKYIKLFKLK